MKKQLAGCWYELDYRSETGWKKVYLYPDYDNSNAERKEACYNIT